MKTSPKFVSSLTDETIMKDRSTRYNRIRKGKSAGLWFGNWNQPWNNSGGARSIGKCMKLINEVNPETFPEWYRAYMEAYGDRLYTSAKNFYKFCIMNPNTYLHKMDISTALDHATIHAIDETWEGWQREKQLCAILQERIDAAGYTEFTVQPAPSDVDHIYKIDCEVVNSHGRILAGVQIKTAKFFGNFSVGSQWRNDMSRKHAAYREETGANTYFLFFENEEGEERKPLLRKEVGHLPNGDIAYDTTEDLLFVLERA